MIFVKEEDKRTPKEDLRILLKKIKSIYGVNYKQYVSNDSYQINISSKYYMIVFFTNNLKVKEAALYRKDRTSTLIKNLLDEDEVNELSSCIDTSRQIIDFINEEVDKHSQLF